MTTEASAHPNRHALMSSHGQERPSGSAENRGSGVTWPVRSGLIPPLAEGFIARPEAVPALEAALVPGAVVALVPGQTGEHDRACGKTQQAAYAAGSLWRSRAVELLVWVSAISRASVLSGYTQAAAKLGLDDGGDAGPVAAARLVAWLAGTSRSWLVVLDDVRFASDLEGLWPAGPSGTVLITTADPATVGGRRGVVTLGVPGFSGREALAFLSDRLTASPEQRGGAADLIADLGGEPVVLAQAAAVIASSGMSCREYRRFFLDQREQLAVEGGVPPVVAATWTLSARYAACLCPGGGTWLVLALAAVLEGDGIPGSVFTAPSACRYLAEQGTVPEPDPGAVWAALFALERAGLVTIDQACAPAVVRVSRAVQAAVRVTAPPEVMDGAAHAAAGALMEVWPTDEPRSWVAASLRSCAASLLAGGAVWAGGGCHRVLWLAGHSLDAAGLADPAVAWWWRLAVDCGRLLGSGHPDTLAAEGFLAGSLMAAGRAGEAVSWWERVVAGRASVLGPDDRLTVAGQIGLGRALVAVRRAGDAMVVLKEAAASGERARGPGDAGTLAAREEYAAACLTAGNAAGAIGSYRRSLADRERLQGMAHPGTLAVALKLAGAYLAAGDAEVAVAGYKRVLAAREIALGAGHLDTLAVRSCLAAAYDVAGQMSAALQQHEEVCAGYGTALGADHPATLARRADLARAYYAAGQAGDAVAVLRDAIARSEQALSPGDPLAVALRETLAGITAEMTAG